MSGAHYHSSRQEERVVRCHQDRRSGSRRNPPRFFGRHRALQNLTAKLIDPIPVQLHEQTDLVLARRIFTQNDFAPSTVDLADCPLAVGCMPFFLETQLVDVKPEGALNVGHRRALAARTSDERSAR